MNKLSLKNFFSLFNKNKNTSVFTIDNASEIIINKVKKQSYYAYVVGRTYPSNLKISYFAYHAFYLEILKSRFISRESSVIKTRLNFWEERLTELAKHIHKEKKSENLGKEISFAYSDPLEVCLLHALRNSNIKIETLFRIIDFQFFDLERKAQLNTIEDLEIYAENTKSLLLYLNLNLLNINDEQAFIVASHVGRALGIIEVLKRMSGYLRLDVNLMPKSLVDKHAGSVTFLYDRRGDINERFYDIILEMAAYAKKHLEVARNLVQDKPLKNNAHVAFLEAVEASYWLVELEKLNFNNLDASLQKPSLIKVPRMILKHGKEGKF